MTVNTTAVAMPASAFPVAPPTAIPMMIAITIRAPPDLIEARGHSSRPLAVPIFWHGAATLRLRFLDLRGRFTFELPCGWWPM